MNAPNVAVRHKHLEPGDKPQPRLNDADTIAKEIVEKLTYSIGKTTGAARIHDWLEATTLVVRDRVIDNWFNSTIETRRTGAKRVCYLSMEFLIGRLLRDAISNLGLTDPIREALARYDVELDLVELLEPDAALGNGGLGRLAACFMESMASTGVPGYGYGIRYVHGFFRQEIVDGAQVELPETWLKHGNPWEFERRESSYEIGFGGKVSSIEENGRTRFVWRPPSACSRSPTTRRPSAGAARTSTRCASGARSRSTRSCSTPSTRATTSARFWNPTRRRRSPASSIPPIRTRPARSCACARSSSSPRPRCRTSSAIISPSTTT